MIRDITLYLERLERRLIECEVVLGYETASHDATLTDGKLRVRVRLANGDRLEVFEYVTLDINGFVARQKYSYHWQGAAGTLVRRWDNAPHHPELPYAPHHMHRAIGSVEGVVHPPDLPAILTEIETLIVWR